MINNNIRLSVIVKDRAITEYFHRGQTFIEGRAGSDYEIEIRNDNHFRVEAVLSVDGLSVIDGKTAGPNSTGYLVEAKSSLRIPGWKLTSEAVAKFTFGSKDTSYSTAMTGSANNNGVIGVMVFQEKRQPVPVAHFQSHQPMGLTSVPTSPFNIACYYNGNASQGPQGVQGAQGPLGVASSMSLNNSDPVTSSSTRGYYEPTIKSVATPQVNLFSLGTQFGESADFSTQEVQFERGDMLLTMVVYYDEIRALRARGVVVDKPKVNPLPQAFPTVGCTPPPNWKG